MKKFRFRKDKYFKFRGSFRTVNNIIKGSYVNLSESKLPVMQEINYSELIETIVSNKGSKCSTADIVEELNSLIKIRTQEANNLCNNTMNYIIDEVRSYE